MNALIVNPDMNGKTIRQRLQKLGVQCDVFLGEQPDYLLDYGDKKNYRKYYLSLDEIMSCANKLNYQLVIAGSPLAKRYCDSIIKQLGLQGTVIINEQVVSTNTRYKIVSWR